MVVRPLQLVHVQIACRTPSLLMDCSAFLVLQDQSLVQGKKVAHNVHVARTLLEVNVLRVMRVPSQRMVFHARLVRKTK